MNKYMEINIIVKGLPEELSKFLIKVFSGILTATGFTDFSITTSEKSEEVLISEVENDKNN